MPSYQIGTTPFCREKIGISFCTCPKGRDYRKLGEKSPMEIRAEGGDVKFSRLEVYPLKSIH